MSEPGVFLIGMTIFVVAIFFGANIMVKAGCEAGANQNEVGFRYSFLGGCSYKHASSGLWIPRENYRAAVD